MRKSILIFSLIVVTIVIVTFCAREDRYSTNMLLLENVEALAYGEILVKQWLNWQKHSV